MKISLIVATAENNAIGKDNQLLWHLPNDLRYFKSKTWALPIVMGRKTFESIAGKALPGRLNIVVTRNESWQAPEDVVIAKDIQQAIDIASSHDYKEIMIAGGGEIYKQSMAIADKIYLTRVHAVIGGDTFFPELTSEWHCTSKQDFDIDEKHVYRYSFEEWEKS